ncbi:uncharacterized protein C05D11.1-like isoform X4 [Daktulosphaira vitifoliae]|uniref:uncharacterized protein C05D11.1-like isoform X4 n=1 Tax=Daktulosphaira vitifoliae TaxID=58002 RepID=UPI0021A9C30C|nr:uncharacterized protein C05D11.1-like isoform X4 [Daktulosphaira vitifoliae]
MKGYLFVVLQSILIFGHITDIINANDGTIKQHFADKYSLLNHSLFENVIPVYKYQCLRTGITIVFGDIDGPVVNGYFTLATETLDDDGIPHTLEHLIFSGSEDYPYNGVIYLLANRCFVTKIGAKTSVDHTCYTVSTAGSEGFLSLLPIYLDHILYPTLTDSNFITQVHHITSDGKDAGVVYCEIQALENTAETIVYQSFLKKVYPGKCGYKSVHGGTMKNLRESTTIEKIRKYHQAYYRPENLLLLVTGKVEHSSLFNSLEPVIQKFLSKGSRGEYVKPWQNPVDPLMESSNNVELFPCDEETNGYINIGWRGPVGPTYSYKYMACKLLLNYLTRYIISFEFVQIYDPLCSSVTFNISNTLNSHIVLIFQNVPIKKIKEEQIPLKLNEIFQKLIRDDGYFNLKRLIASIKTYKLELIQSNLYSALSTLIIRDFLYGKSQSDFDEILNTNRIFYQLLREDILYWKNILRDYLLNDYKVIVKGIPSIQKQHELANEEIRRVLQRKKDLGDDGLKLKAIELLNAKTECEKKLPNEIFTSFKIPNVEFGQLLTHDSFSSNSLNQHNLFKTSEVPLFVEIDNVKSNFIYLRAFINTKDLPLNLRKYLPIFLDLIMNSPVILTGENYTNLHAELENDVVSWKASIGIESTSSFSCGYFSSVVLLTITGELEKYHKCIKWLHNLLYNTVVNKKKLSYNLSRKINEVSNYRRNGKHMLNQIFINMTYKQDSNPYICSVLGQYKFLTSLQKAIETEKGWKIVYEDFNKLKLFLANPDNIKLHITGNIDKLCDIIPEASAALQNIIPDNLKRPVHPFKTQFDSEFMLPLNQCGIRACIVGIGSIESSYFIQSTDCIKDCNHQDFASLCAFVSYFTQVEIIVTMIVIMYKKLIRSKLTLVKGSIIFIIVKKYKMGDIKTLFPGTIVGFGNPLLDMSIIGDENLLKKYELKSNNAILAEEKHMPLYEELINCEKVEYTAGGSAQNSLRVAQWILKEPNVTVFFGAVGKDKYSDILKQKANEEGLTVHYQFTPEKPTGTCAVIVTNKGKDRSLCANLSAAQTFSEDHLQLPENRAIIENAKFYLTTGFFLQVNVKAVKRVAEIARQRKYPFLFNISAPFICQFYMNDVMSIFHYVTILIGNDEEAKAFSEAQKWNFDTTEDIARKLSTFEVDDSQKRLVIITQGDKPVIAATDGVISHYPVSKIPTSEIVDTNGAGDAFVGGFVGRYILGCSLEESINSGIKAASYIIKRPGITRGDCFDL